MPGAGCFCFAIEIPLFVRNDSHAWNDCFGFAKEIPCRIGMIPGLTRMTARLFKMTLTMVTHHCGPKAY